MRNADLWQPSKYRRKGARVCASSDTTQLSIGSRLIAQLLIDRYVPIFERYARGTLADLGCGLVPFYDMYRNLVRTIVTVDWEQSQHDRKFIDVTCDLNGALPFKDNSFDTILLSDVLEHVAMPEVLLRESFRILVPGGHLIGNVPFYYPLHERPHDFYRFTEFGLRHLAERASFTVELIEPIGGAIEVLGDLSTKLMARIAPLGPVAKGMVKSCIWLGRTRWGRKQMVRTAREFPLGYVMVLRRPIDDEIVLAPNLSELPFEC